VAAAVTAVPSFPVLARLVPADALHQACGAAPGIACRLAWDLTHSMHAASFTTVYLAGPVRLILKVSFVLLLAVLLRLAAQRLITRLINRVAPGPVRPAGGPRPGVRTAAGGADGYDPADGQPAADGPAEDGPPEDEQAGSELADGPPDDPAGHGAGSRPGAGRRRVFGERRGQRATALATLLGNAATVTIFSVAAVIILGDLGLNLAPVLASAGVLGIAIGFGAQNLVKDFLAGVFMLLEDQYGVGDYLDVGSVAGTVEAVSLRITRLRDINGVVWHIRNGTIKRAGNETHGWARAVIDFPVPYPIPVTAARSALDRAVAALWLDPAWHDLILERPQVWGVEDVSADTVLIRVAARTVPEGKLDVARELRERLKAALDDEPGAGSGRAVPDPRDGTQPVPGLVADPPEQPGDPARQPGDPGS
jgi:small-conductance mechanosensitive channel